MATSQKYGHLRAVFSFLGSLALSLGEWSSPEIGWCSVGGSGTESLPCVLRQTLGTPTIVLLKMTHGAAHQECCPECSLIRLLLSWAPSPLHQEPLPEDLRPLWCHFSLLEVLAIPAWDCVLDIYEALHLFFLYPLPQAALRPLTQLPGFWFKLICGALLVSFTQKWQAIPQRRDLLCWV